MLRQIDDDYDLPGYDQRWRNEMRDEREEYEESCVERYTPLPGKVKPMTAEEIAKWEAAGWTVWPSK